MQQRQQRQIVNKMPSIPAPTVRYVALNPLPVPDASDLNLRYRYLPFEMNDEGSDDPQYFPIIVAFAVWPS